MPTLAKVLRELKVEDTLLYLDQVKMAFGEKPEIYNKFLDIMKNFKAQEIDTPGVIQQVSRLFRGYNKLILGFNTFLPDGYKVELPLHGDDTTMTVITPSGVSASVVGGHISPNNLSEIETKQNAGNAMPKASEATVRGEAASAPVEFDHAITYVTTIKKRFAHEPETYKAFLEILHTYQKEQRSIKDVLEQVSQLFADHSDLLREFTYFLPDAVQEQAKERLSRAVRESELRKAHHGGSKYSSGASIRCAPIRRSASRGSRTTLDPIRGSQDLTLNVAPMPMLNIQATAVAEPTTRARVSSTQNTKRTNEQRMFERIRESFLLASETAIGATDGWNKFLKCLDLYSQDILPRSDLIKLVTELFSSHVLRDDLLDSLSMMLRDREHADSISFNDRYLAPEELSCTQTYRTSSASLTCSGRSRLEHAVLNDMCSAKNVAFEQQLLQCEDERFKLDMIINGIFTSVAVLHTMAPISDQNSENHQYTLREVREHDHLNLVLKAYGKHGIELLELLHKIPQHAIPIILGRLRRRAATWRQYKKSLSGHGASCVMDRHELNCQKECKAILPRHLVLDIMGLDTGTTAKNSMYLPLGRSSIQRMLFHLIYNATEQSSILQIDKQLIAKFWQHFFFNFVQLSTDDIVKRTQHNGNNQSSQQLCDGHGSTTSKCLKNIREQSPSQSVSSVSG
mmetsp:Transcript_29391/g.90951  ORF Transcript_29391/g.90951 Transcript_29391/m.90951 type:complete len:684 (-) Transcript_29391:996-3047(-)